MIYQKKDLIVVKEEVFSPYRVSDYLTNQEEVEAYIKAAKEENDPALLDEVIKEIQRIAPETLQNMLRG